MSRSKEFFLSALDIYTTENLATDNIILQHLLEDEPFGILTERNGHTVLSVGNYVDKRKGMVVCVPLDD